MSAAGRWTTCVWAEAAVPARAVRYDRARDLPRLISVWPSEIESLDAAGHAALIAKIERVLRAERRRGLAGHWTYDLARHSQLLSALRVEVEALAHAHAQRRKACRAP